jgi:hypothetical protein
MNLDASQSNWGDELAACRQVWRMLSNRASFKRYQATGMQEGSTAKALASPLSFD